MKMSAATATAEIKYVYVNYVVSPNATHDITAMLEANKTEMVATDATSYGQFIEILQPQHIEEANQPAMLLQHHHFVASPELKSTAFAATVTADTTQFVSPTDCTELPTPIPQTDDDMDVLGHDIVCIAEVVPSSRPIEDHLQRLTNEILYDTNEDDGALDSSCGGSFINYSEEEAEDDDSEHDLTNLAWLSDPNRSIAVNVLSAVAEESPEKMVEEPVEKEKKEKIVRSSKPASAVVEEIKDPAEILIRDKTLTQERFNKFMLQVQECQQSYILNEITYRDNAAEKPPFIYAQIIAMAMVEQGRMTLKDIEQWIQARFAYYRCNGNWNNSIRHNLSIHFGFTKIARDKNEKGKGGYWELSMNITKGEKKRVRNRSKRGLANGAKNGVAGSKRPRRLVVGATGKAKVRREIKAVVPMKVDEVQMEQEELQIATDMLLKVLPQTAEGGAQMSDGYETACSDATTSNGYEADVYASTLLHDGANEIFLGCDIPLSGDCIVIPYTGQPTATPSSASSNSPSSYTTTTMTDSTPSSPSIASPSYYTNPICMASQLTAHATLIAHGLTNPTFGPNVIVEALPYGATSTTQHNQSVLDQVVDIERQFSSMVQLPEPELMAEYDAYFDYSW